MEESISRVVIPPSTCIIFVSSTTHEKRKKKERNVLPVRYFQFRTRRKELRTCIVSLWFLLQTAFHSVDGVVKYAQLQVSIQAKNRME